MEREHLYRGKRVDNGEWVEGYLISNNVIVGGIIELNEEYFNTEFWCVVDPETVGQFVGMYDTTKWEDATESDKQYAYELAKKNGTNAETEWRGIRMFEGDIVKYYHPFAKRIYIHVVKYDTMFARFCLFEKDNKWAKESDWMNIQDVEVIGNIQENMELLTYK